MARDRSSVKNLTHAVGVPRENTSLDQSKMFKTCGRYNCRSFLFRSHYQRATQLHAPPSVRGQVPTDFPSSSMHTSCTHNLTESIEEKIAGEERRFRVDEVLPRRFIVRIGHCRLEKSNRNKVLRSAIVGMMAGSQKALLGRATKCSPLTAFSHGIIAALCTQESVRVCPTRTANTCMRYNLLAEGHVVTVVLWLFHTRVLGSWTRTTARTNPRTREYAEVIL